MTVGAGGTASADLAYLRERLEQYKKTFPRLDMLGWYSTAGAVLEGDMALHQQLCELNESLLYLALDPAPLLGGGGGTGELPIALFESEVAVLNDMPTMRFAKIGYKVRAINRGEGGAASRALQLQQGAYLFHSQK
jgi:COP9 signalosome complex subunit 6